MADDKAEHQSFHRRVENGERVRCPVIAILGFRWRHALLAGRLLHQPALAEVFAILVITIVILLLKMVPITAFSEQYTRDMFIIKKLEDIDLRLADLEEGQDSCARCASSGDLFQRAACTQRVVLPAKASRSRGEILLEPRTAGFLGPAGQESTGIQGRLTR